MKTARPADGEDSRISERFVSTGFHWNCVNSSEFDGGQAHEHKLNTNWTQTEHKPLIPSPLTAGILNTRLLPFDSRDQPRPQRGTPRTLAIAAFSSHSRWAEASSSDRRRIPHYTILSGADKSRDRRSRITWNCSRLSWADGEFELGWWMLKTITQTNAERLARRESAKNLSNPKSCVCFFSGRKKLLLFTSERLKRLQ